MNVVTTFSANGWETYGKRFVESFGKHWPDECQLHVFLENQPTPAGFPKVDWHRLDFDPEHEAFVRKYAGKEYNHPTDFNEMSVRFCHKVFALTNKLLPMVGWRVWIDADVLFKRDVTAFLPSLFPSGKALTYLGRQGEMRPGQPAYTECGFVGYNTDVPKVRALLHDMRAIYTTGKLFTLGKHNWHDSYVFDHCRQHLEFEPAAMNNLSFGLPGTHVWPQSILGQFSAHQKGPKRKAEVYGQC